MISIWSDTSELPRFDSLEKDIKTEVLIIGGGMAGILTAYMLGEAGISYVLAEAKTICSGITKNTTAKITSQHGLIYGSLMDRFGTEKTKMYYEANEKALEKYRDMCQNIKCGFENKNAFVYTKSNMQKLEKELNALGKIGADISFADRIPVSLEAEGAVMFKNQAQFNPLQFIKAIAEKLNIYENTRVIDIRGKDALTEKGKITAEKIVVATHFPFLNKHGRYFLKMYQHRSYVVALENVQPPDGMYIDENKTGISLRSCNNMMLIGGGAHRTGKKGESFQAIEGFADKYYPSGREKYRWATQDCMTLDNVPYIGHYSKGTPDVYVATGFNKWGMTSSMVSSMILRDMILGRENPYAPVFSPSRTMIRKQLFINGFEAVTNIVRITKKRCPHMGCGLKWNDSERTWDCPCHGSRFEENGELIDNPSTGDLKK